MLPNNLWFDVEREKIHRQILSAVSHDLKTPLATIIGTLEIYKRMKDRLTPSKIEALLDSALYEAKRLDGFITNILDMAKLESSTAKINKETFILGDLVNDCIARLNYRTTKKIFRANKNKTPLSVVSDPALLTRAVVVILDNVLKHCDVNAQAVIDHGQHDDHFYIQVTDNGPGIAEGKTEEIFEKYTRFAAGDKQNAGTGLGLAMCRLIMTALGGSVTGENLPGGGALFCLRFPSDYQRSIDDTLYNSGLSCD
jgi:K+-sensing histidine kinase KdpD